MALETARALLAAGGQAVLLHVIETIADAEFEDLSDFYQRLEDKARSSMKVLAESLASDEISVEQHVVYGKRATAIVAFAREDDSDLIIMSAQSLDPDRPQTAWGSISHQVAVLARCPVLLLK